MTHTRTLAAALGAATLLLVAAFPGGTTVVSDAGGGPGLSFSNDAPYTTPFSFTTDAASTGSGSLAVAPITNDTGDAAKFIAYVSDPSGDPFGGLEEVAFDVLVAPEHDDQVYLNVYWVVDGSGPAWFDCKYDYLASGLGGTSFATLSTSTVAPSQDERNAAWCPADPAALPDEAVTLYAAINVGDTSGNDLDAGAHIDNVVVTVAGVTSTYDLEAPGPTTKDDCKDGGWEAYGFENQGRCVSSVVTG